MHYERDTAECSGLLLKVNLKMRRNNRNRFSNGLEQVDETGRDMEGEGKC
jgi:hypothetical protein